MELDILRDKTHDLAQEDAWARIFSLVQKPKTVFVTTPPCHTFSRARHRKPGPPPLRSVDWPKGFPWLSEKHYQKVEASLRQVLMRDRSPLNAPMGAITNPSLVKTQLLEPGGQPQQQVTLRPCANGWQRLLSPPVTFWILHCKHRGEMAQAQTWTLCSRPPTLSLHLSLAWV